MCLKLKDITMEANTNMGVVAGIVVKDNRVLLLFHSKLCKWTLPMGKVEEGELPLNAISRELYEELDINLINSKVLIEKEYIFSDIKTRDVTVFDITSYDGKLVNKEPDKHRSIIWLSFNEICCMKKYQMLDILAEDVLIRNLINIT